MFDKDFWLRLAQILWGSSLTKLGSSIAVIGAFALTGSLIETLIASAFAYYDKPSPVPNLPIWIGFSVFFTGIAVSILGAYWQRPLAPKEPNPHDIELLQRYRGEFTEGRKDFLRDHNFWDSFDSAVLDFVTEVAYWRGARFEFVDDQVEAPFSVVKKRAQHFDDLVGMKTWPHRVAPNRQTALPDNHDEWQPHPQIVKSVNELNQAARELLAAADEFERVSKFRIPIV
ncbi:hypothetical protein FHS55_003131 [Angulomicrobium tetraedrale]|uniref:Uncharacterized protein n=1 Tax=Ancylobacter tetraedralis TaxID=217068 RepID=A0A839ZCH6_9HYPH|nr:hypothetical protein [Ancylobacter tetraedralis]MBB3772510.1 hypothetical protein [Ancylobacter tetraedralis]